MSAAGALCVKRPTEMKVTPVSAFARILSRVTPPDASVGPPPSLRATAVSRPQIDPHYLAKAWLQLVEEDAGTLWRKAQKRQARADKRRP